MPAARASRAAVLRTHRSGLRSGSHAPPRSLAKAQGLVQESDLPEHLTAQRQDEREAIVSLHPPDGNANELAVAIQHAPARDTRMPVGEARHQIVGRALPDVTGRED